MQRTSDTDRSRLLARRAVLKAGAGASVAALLAACGGGKSSSPSAPVNTPSGASTTAPSPATTAPTTAATRGAASAVSAAAKPGSTAAVGSPVGSPAAQNATIAIVNTGAKLPTDQVTVHWVDSGDAKEPFNKRFFAAYQKAHANITVNYDPLPQAEIAKLVPLGIENGNAPDLFSLPQGLTGGQAVAQGWVQPLDDLIPDFANWKKAFPPGALVSGFTDFNGKTYSIPYTSNQRYSTLTLYNVAYLQKAGVDPAAKPLTWDAFRAAAKKITEQGQGKYYGLVLEGGQTARFAVFVSSLAQMAGASGSGGNDTVANFNWKTGQFNYLTDQYLAAIDLLLGIKADGSIFPGSLSLNAAQARSQFPNGVAGMILQGPWNIPGWKQDNPDFNFGVGSQPVPNSGTVVPLYYEPGGGNAMWVYAKSRYQAVAGDLLYNMGTLANQKARGIIGGAADPPIFSQAAEAVSGDPLGNKAQSLFEQQMRLGPSPAVRNPDVAKVYLELKKLTPDFGEVVQGLFSGQLSDPKKAMQDLKDRSDKELDRAIKAAQAKGAKVSRDDFVFPNWDPTKDYTDADYAALK